MALAVAGDLNVDQAVLGLAVGVVVALTVVVARTLRGWTPTLTAAAMVGVLALAAAESGPTEAGPLAFGALLGAVAVVAVPRPAAPFALQLAAGAAAAALVTLAVEPRLGVPTAVVAFVATPAAVLGGADVARRVPARLTAVLVVLALGGVYGGVPDTEWILRLLGVAIPVALLTVGPEGVRSGVELGLRGAAGPLVVLLWVASSSSEDQMAPAIGAVGCLGLLLVLPLARLAARREIATDARTSTLLAAVQVLVVGVSSRIAAISGDGRLALAVVAVALLGGGLLSWAVLVAGGLRTASPEPPPP